VAAETRQRLDKWLWFARIARTRVAAAALVAAGQVRLNRVKMVKPGHDVGPGDTLTIAVAGRVRVLRVKALDQRRRSATEAIRLYDDLAMPGENAGPPQKGDASGGGTC
jgi:ribosome-associated heat shock protein Hsp15